MKWGYLREHSTIALAEGNDPITHLPRTGLDQYLKVIFPKTNDWKYNEKIPKAEVPTEIGYRKFTPDYRSKSLKIIVEFDGIPHYKYYNEDNEETNEKQQYYFSLGYKVVRIPYFIQLTTKVVSQLFNLEIKDELCDASLTSLTPFLKNTPPYLSGHGIIRMASEYHKFPEQFALNIQYLKKLNDEKHTGAKLLEMIYNNIEKYIN